MDAVVESFLDEKFLKKLERLKILAQKRIIGHGKGEHRSMKSGVSLEFQDYRKYQEGDDFRYIDWNVYGRLDRLFIKLFHAEEDLPIRILMDMSGSMGTGSLPKDIYAKKLAATLCYIGLANLDRVGIIAFAESLRESKPPKKGRQVYIEALKYLVSLEPEGDTDLNSCLTEVALSAKRPGVAVVISDLLDPKGYRDGFQALRTAKMDTTIIQVLDHGEISPSLSGAVTMRDVETGKKKNMTLDSGVVDSFEKRVRRFIEDIREFCLVNSIDYHLADTAIPFEDFILDLLTKGSLFR